MGEDGNSSAEPEAEISVQKKEPIVSDSAAIVVEKKNIFHIVTQGETLSEIAQLYHVKVKQLTEIENFSSS